MTKELMVIGGGLAGCEAAWQAAELGLPVKLYEMRPRTTTPAHVTDQLAELVCRLRSDCQQRFRLVVACGTSETSDRVLIISDVLAVILFPIESESKAGTTALRR